MIKRLYIHNYRCFENFELKLDGRESVLLLGRNGSGKSSLANALRVFQWIGRDWGSVSSLLKLGDVAQKRLNEPIRLEIAVEIDSSVYEYVLVCEILGETRFKGASILQENFSVDGTCKFERNQADVKLVADSTEFKVDVQKPALPVIQLKEDNAPLATFLEWLTKMLIIEPVPAIMAGEQRKEHNSLSRKYLTNFATWFSTFLSEYPAAYRIIEEFLKDVMPDFLDFRNKRISDTVTAFVVRFGDEKEQLEVDFKEISDGEKCFFVCATVIAMNELSGPRFCFWDEPDNFMSLSEVAHVVMALRKSFQRKGQIFLASHNPEAIRKFSDENTLLLDRKSRLEPTTHRWLSELNRQGDLVESLIRGDLGNGSQ